MIHVTVSWHPGIVWDPSYVIYSLIPSGINPGTYTPDTGMDWPEKSWNAERNNAMIASFIF